MPLYAPPPGPPPATAYAPPPGPPPTRWEPKPFVPTPFPQLTAEQVHSLATKGFTTFPIAQRSNLFDAASSLFTISRDFFAIPEDGKLQYQVRAGNAQGSEEGWSRVPGEKELLTLRRGGKACPPSVESTGRTLWKECGTLMQEVINGIERTLALPPGSFDNVVKPECVMPEDGENRVETLLRMFRYERRSAADDNATPHGADAHGKGRLVAEPHRDLGILSLVIGASPGLEVYDNTVRAWVPIEQPPHANPDLGLTATLLVGETLTRLTNGRYVPGVHRVFVPSAEDSDSQFRYSLVFALRPHAKAILSTTKLTTPVTGLFSHPIEGKNAQELFAAIARSHWNVNTGQKEREAQRRRLQAQSTPAEQNIASGGQTPSAS